MKYQITHSLQQSHDTKISRNADLPLHDMGQDFFAMETIQDGNDYHFNGTHRHDFYELLWFTDATPRQAHFIDFIKYPIHPNQLFLLLPDQVHSIEKKDKTGFLFAISKDFFERLIGKDIFTLFYYTVNFSVLIPDSQLHIFQTLLKLIKVESDGAKRPAILESYLRSWFLHCIELQKAGRFEEKRDIRMQFLIESIDRHFKEERNAGFYAHELSLSAKRLNELSKDYFGKTINQIINDRLILAAKREISSCEKSIKEISYELGFSEPSYFTRFFGKQTGYTPEKFRERMSNIFQ